MKNRCKSESLFGQTSTCSRTISQIPQCTCPTSHNAPFRTEMCTFLFWMVHSGLPTSKIFFPYFVEKISVFWVTFPYPLICSSPDSKHSLWQLPIYSGGTHPLPVETLVDSFGTTGTGSWQEHMLLPHVEERRLNVLVIKEVFEGFKA